MGYEETLQIIGVAAVLIGLLFLVLGIQSFFSPPSNPNQVVFGALAIVGGSFLVKIGR